MKDYYVTVCGACLRASCWHGDDLCDESRNAGTVIERASILRKEGREHSDNYSVKKLIDVCCDVDFIDEED